MAREPARWPTRAEYAEHLKPPAENALEPGRAELPQRGMAREFAGVRADDGSWVAVFPEPLHAELSAKYGIDESLALAELFRRGVLQVAPSSRAEGKWLTRVRLEPKPATTVPMYKLALPSLEDEEEEITGQPSYTERDDSGATGNTETPSPNKRSGADSPGTPGTPQVNTGMAPGTPTGNPTGNPQGTPAQESRLERVSERFAAPAVVADSDGGYLARTDRMEQIGLPELGGLADVADWAAGLRLGVEHAGTMPDDAVAAILPGLAARLGLPGSAPDPKSKAARDHPALGALRAAGWQGAPALASWMKVYRPGGRSVRLWLPGWDEFGTCPMWGDGVPAADLAYRLGLFAQTTGIGWRLTGGITGVDLGATFKRRSLHLVAAEPPKPALSGGVGHAFHWSRHPAGDESGLGWVHCYDGNAAYLAAYNTAVNVGGWRHEQAPRFDPKLPGYWLVDPADPAARLLPDLLDPTGRAAATGYTGPRWCVTPTLALAAELGYEITPREAYLPAGDHGRYWEAWYKRVRDARSALLAQLPDPEAAAVLEALKMVWHATHSQVGIKSQGTRRDHDQTITAAYGANLMRRLVKVAELGQRWPLAIGTDAVAFASADPDPAASCPPGMTLGHGLGEFKVQGTLPMAAAAPLLGTGRSASVSKLFDLAADYARSGDSGA